MERTWKSCICRWQREIGIGKWVLHCTLSKLSCEFERNIFLRGLTFYVWHTWKKSCICHWQRVIRIGKMSTALHIVKSELWIRKVICYSFKRLPNDWWIETKSILFSIDNENSTMIDINSQGLHNLPNCTLRFKSNDISYFIMLSHFNLVQIVLLILIFALGSSGLLRNLKRQIHHHLLLYIQISPTIHNSMYQINFSRPT